MWRLGNHRGAFEDSENTGAGILEDLGEHRGALGDLSTTMYLESWRAQGCN